MTRAGSYKLETEAQAVDARRKPHLSVISNGPPRAGMIPSRRTVRVTPREFILICTLAIAGSGLLGFVLGGV